MVDDFDEFLFERNLSCLFLNELTLLASTTSFGSSFQSLITLLVKKLALTAQFVTRFCSNLCAPPLTLDAGPTQPKAGAGLFLFFYNFENKTSSEV
jgi:hypothetical protein